jgi:endonuclease III
MKKKERAHIVKKVLDELFPDPAICLHHKDPYTLLIAVLLSAQSTDARVNEITPHLFKKASSPRQMVRLSVKEIEEIIRPCGLGPTKARAIWNLSQQLIDRHESRVPDNFEDLEALPGVGHKTASVVMSQAFGHPALAVDTHVHRCAKRWGLSSGKSVVQTEKDLKALYPKTCWSRLHLQIIYFARAYCTARQHDSKTCPICKKL